MTKIGRASAACAALVLAGVLCQPADASLIDWHVTPGGTSFAAGQFANWLPYGGANPNNANNAASGITNGISWTIWDGYGAHGNATTGTHHNAWDFGGQEYDVKAMYARCDAQNLYVGIVTGFNPAGLQDSPTNPTWYYPGDLAIDPDWAHSTSRLGVIMPAAAAGSSGSTAVYSGGAWYTPTPDWAAPPYSSYKSGGTNAGGAIYRYSNLGINYYDAATQSNKNMFLLEVTVPLSVVGQPANGDVGVSWAITCNNDFASITQVYIPEPASLAALALSGLLVLKRRRR